MQRALILPVFRCVIEDDSHTAIRANGDANLTVNNSRISARYYGISVSSSQSDGEIWIPGSGVETSNTSVIVENTEIYGGSYAVRCSGRAIDCRVANSHLKMNTGQVISCHNVRSCTVQHCTLNSSHLYELAVSAANVQTLIIDGNIIANKTSGQVVRASQCHSVQVRIDFHLELSNSAQVQFDNNNNNNNTQIASQINLLQIKRVCFVKK